ncbi:hypothetical protein ACVGXX_00130, partial [Enterobacter intestinihominis]
ELPGINQEEPRTGRCGVFFFVRSEKSDGGFVLSGLGVLLPRYAQRPRAIAESYKHLPANDTMMAMWDAVFCL